MSDHGISFKLLVLESEAADSSLLKLLRENHPAEDIVVAESIQAAEKLLRSGSFEALVLHRKQLSPSELADSVRLFAQQFPELVLVAALPEERKAGASCLQEAGAHGLLLLPASGAAVRQTFRSAFQAADSSAAVRSGPSREQVANFPWILENIASRLDALAAKLREAETSSGVAPAANARHIKEALIGALGSTQPDEQFCDEFVNWLQTKSAAGKPDKK